MHFSSFSGGPRLPSLLLPDCLPRAGPTQTPQPLAMTTKMILNFVIAFRGASLYALGHPLNESSSFFARTTP